MDRRHKECVEQAEALALEYGAKVSDVRPNKKARVVITITHGDEHRTLYWPLEQGNWRTNRNLETQARHILEAWLGPPKPPPKPQRMAPDPMAPPDKSRQPTPPRPIATQALDKFISPFNVQHEEFFSAVMDGRGREVCRSTEPQDAVWVTERFNHAKVPMRVKEKSIGLSVLEALSGEFRRRESLHLNQADTALDAQQMEVADCEEKLANAFAFAAGTLESLVDAETKKNAAHGANGANGNASENQRSMSGLRR